MRKPRERFRSQRAAVDTGKAGVMTATVTPISWRALAACGDADPDLFAAPDSDKDEKPRTKAIRERRAQRVCASCLVTADCLDFAVSNSIEDGVWGGMTEHGRASMIRRNRRTARLENAS